MRRTKEDAALTRENLLDVALASFRARGYFDLNISILSREVPFLERFERAAVLVLAL